ncbi:MAG: GNAT family N-acetyltransferase [Proteobacteria bacterium]|nr:GNAT family N-acetyltransferase [Pseudomonadota bacterium]
MESLDQGTVNTKLLAQSIEPAIVASWPARETMQLEGWLLRFTNGYTHRGNSVAALGDVGDVEAAIEAVEAAYGTRGLSPMFSISPASRPSSLEDDLILRGYERTAPTLACLSTVQTMLLCLPKCETLYAERARHPAMDALVISGSRSEAEAAERLETLDRIELPRLCVVAFDGKKAVASGLGVMAHGRVSVNMMRTDPAHRRKGYAQRVLAGIANWAQSQGVSEIHLGVEEDNIAARALYTKCGFREAYGSAFYRKS